MTILQTPRLLLRLLCAADADFILELLNEPAFIRNIGDRNVRTREDAVSYIRDGPEASYRRHGFGLYLAELRESGTPVGICGLLKRPALEDPDVGFAFFERFWSRGYASESAAAVLKYGRSELGLGRIVAITATHNEESKRVLRKIGLQFEKRITLAGASAETDLFVFPG